MDFNDIAYIYKICILLLVFICEIFKLYSIFFYCIFRIVFERFLGGCWILIFYFLNLFICFKGVRIDDELIIFFIIKLLGKM